MGYEGLTVKPEVTEVDEPAVANFATTKDAPDARKLDIGNFSRHDVVVGSAAVKEAVVKPTIGSFDTDERKVGVRKIDVGDFSRHDLVFETPAVQE